ncbi:MAG: alpha-L-rhamnosidase N-terminal domain-containing protein, partial [Bryobacteraceae bacterium]
MQRPSRRGFLRNSLSTAAAAPLASPAVAPSTEPTRLPNAAWIPKTLDHWRARWIWDDYNRETTNIYVCLRKVVNLQAAPRAADVWVTANSVYKLWINGVEAGRGPEPNEPPFKFYDYYELTKLFHPGENIIAALAYNFGIGTHFYGAGPGGFLLEAHLFDAAGRETVVVTDNTWRAALPRWYS